MELEVLEREALKLSPRQRAKLARELLDSLDALPTLEIDGLWLDEAGRRASQIDGGEAQLVDAEEVDRKASALLR